VVNGHGTGEAWDLVLLQSSASQTKNDRIHSSYDIDPPPVKIGERNVQKISKILAITCGDDNQIIVLDLHKYLVLASAPICTKEFLDGDGGSGKPSYSDLKQTLFP
jgi:hypothetical protein